MSQGALKLDLHVHTIYSDGRESPEVMLRTAKAIGLDGIAITDHDTFQGSTKVVGVIPGIEVTTQYGHVVVLCERPTMLPNTLPDLLDKVKDENCFSFPSHPFDNLRAGIGGMVYQFRFDGIEVYNSKAPKWANDRALRAAEELKLPGLANSDSHVKSALGSAFNLIHANSLNPEEVLEALRKGRLTSVGKGMGIKAKLEIVQWYLERKVARHPSRALR